MNRTSIKIIYEEKQNLLFF